MAKKMLFLLVFMAILLNACIKTQENLPIKSLNLSKTDQALFEKEITKLLPSCQSNKTYLNENECNCTDTWVRNDHMHSFCTPEKTTTFGCRRLQNMLIVGEVNVFFKSGTTLEKAENIVNKYGGKILVYTCWFENRDPPYLTALVQENKEQRFIDLVKNESLVESAHQNFYATAQ